VTHSGLADLFNDPTTSSIIIKDVEMEKVSKTKGDLESFKQLIITKNQIHCVCLDRKEDVGPRAMRAGYERNIEYAVTITDPCCAYQGTYEWTGIFDFSSMMSGGSGHFIPIVEGVLYSLSNPDFSSISPVFMISKARGYLHIYNEKWHKQRD